MPDLSEFGFQSFDSLMTMFPISKVGDLAINSPLIKFRQRWENGTEYITQQLQHHFNIPNDTDPNVFFQKICIFDPGIAKFMR